MGRNDPHTIGLTPRIRQVEAVGDLRARIAMQERNGGSGGGGTALSVADATTVTKGKLQLAGDIGGTASLIEVKNKLDVFNVMDAAYGATGNGSTNDTTAVQAAINAANSAGGGIVFFPKGTYLCSSLTSHSNIVLKGAGWGSVIKQVAGVADNTYLISVDGATPTPANNKTGIQIVDLQLRGTCDVDAFVSTHQHVHLIHLSAVSDVLISGCLIKGFRGDGVYLQGNDGANLRHNQRIKITETTWDGINQENRNAVSVIDAEDLWIDPSCTFMNCSNPGVAPEGMPGAIDIEPNLAGSIVKDIRIGGHFKNIGGNAGVIGLNPFVAPTTPVKGITIDKVTIRDSPGSIAFLLYGVADAEDADARADIVVSNSKVFGCAEAFEIRGLRGIKFENVTWDGATESAAIGYRYVCRDVEINGCDFIETSTGDYPAITLYNGHRVSIDGNDFDNCGVVAGTDGVALKLAVGLTTSVSSAVRFTRNHVRGARMLDVVEKAGGHTNTAGQNRYYGNVVPAGLAPSYKGLADPYPMVGNNTPPADAAIATSEVYQYFNPSTPAVTFRGRDSGGNLFTHTIGAGITDHGLLTGLTDDDHTQYPLMVGRGNEQIIKGAVNSGGDLTLVSTAHATKGQVFFGADYGSAYDETLKRLGVGHGTPEASLHVQGVASQTDPLLLAKNPAGTEQLKLTIGGDLNFTGKLGVGINVDATHRIKLPTATNSGIDFGNSDTLAYRSAAGTLRVESPSGATSVNLNAASGQASQFLFSEGGTTKWQLGRLFGSNDFRLFDPNDPPNSQLLFRSGPATANNQYKWLSHLTFDSAPVVDRLLHAFIQTNVEGSVSLVNPFRLIDGLGVNNYVNITSGTNGASVIAFSPNCEITATRHLNNEFAYMRGATVDNTGAGGVHARIWGQDVGVHGTPRNEQNAMIGNAIFLINNHYNGSPLDTPSMGVGITTLIGGVGASPAHQATNTYPVDIGLSVHGCASDAGGGDIKDRLGFTYGIMVGGTGPWWSGGGGPWSFTQQDSRIGTGLQVMHYEHVGIKVTNRSSLGGTNPPAISVGWTDTGVASTAVNDGFDFGGDTCLYRSAPSTLKTEDAFVASLGLNSGAHLSLFNTNGTSYIHFEEQTTPVGAADANSVRLYAEDNGSGTTVLRYKDSAAAVVTLGAAGAGGYISSVADTNTIDHTVTGGGELSSIIPTTATPQVTALGAGVAAGANGLGVLNNSSGRKTTAGAFIEASGNPGCLNINAQTDALKNFLICYSSSDGTNVNERFRLQSNTDGSVRLGFRDGTGTVVTLYKPIGTPLRLLTSHSFEITQALTVGTTSTFTGAVTFSTTAAVAGASNNSFVFHENATAPGATAEAAKLYSIDSSGVTELHSRFNTNNRILMRDVAQPAALTASNAALTDNTAGTANTTLQALPDPADTPLTVDALRDDLVANLIPAIRNDFADLTAQANNLRTRLNEVTAAINSSSTGSGLVAGTN